MQTRCCALLVVLAACGGDDGSSATPDAFLPTAPPMITVSGQATKRMSSPTSSPAEGVLIEAFKNGSSTPIAMTTTDAQGNYSLVITTGGVAVDGYLKGTFNGLIDTYLYPPKPLAEDYDMAAINMIDSGTMNLLSNNLCRNAQETTNGVIGLIVADAARMPVAGATVSSTPAAAKYCYNQGGFPNQNAAMTEGDGLAYMLNLPAGAVTVSASMSGTTFSSHQVEARANALTTTVIQP